MKASAQNDMNARDGSAAGSAILELVLVLPVLLYLALGAIELSSWLSVAQRVSLLSREAANFAYRECAERPIVFPGTANAEQCLTNITREIHELAVQQNAGLALRIHLFKAGGVEVAGAAAGTFSHSRVPIIRASPRFGQIVAVTGNVVIAEAEVPYRSLFEGFLPRFWDEMIYETTIM